MTKKETADFDLENAIIELECPDYWKAGLIYYINKNEINIKSEKDFKTIIKKYANLKIGE